MFTRKPYRGEETPEKVEKPVEETKAEKPVTPTTSPVKFSKPLKGSSQMVPSVIGEDLTVEGNIISKGEVQLEGEVNGNIHCTSLVIGDKALVEGGVVADDVIVRGRVVGSIRGHRVTLQSSSHVEGDVFHQSLAIEQGAFFEGKSRRSDDPVADAIAASSEKSGTGSNNPAGSGGGGNEDKSSKSTRAAE
ncbi:MAG: bactofilin family protein [Alphaproteobacteria bacterium]